jgi:hypothetical protein
MSDPKPVKPLCDVRGCGAFAAYRSDGKEADPQRLGREAIPRLNVCEHHRHWPFSEDARAAVVSSAASYNARR